MEGSVSIALSYPISFQEIQKIEEKLKEYNWDIIPIDEFIILDGQSIAIQSYDQLKSKNPGNAYLREFEKQIVENNLDRLSRCDVVLICNPRGKLHFFQKIDLIVGWFIERPIYLFEEIEREDEFKIYSGIFNPIVINKDLSKIIKPFPKSKPILEDVKKEDINLSLLNPHSAIKKKIKKIKIKN